MSQAAYISDMMEHPATNPAAGSPQVASFYANRNVLLTGGTGFLGKLLVERILRSCPNVNTLFFLVREKNEKSPEERLKAVFHDVIFDRLRREQPAFARKIVLIAGDMRQCGLGLSSEHRELLRNTHIVIHSAATVRFDEKLRIAATINVRGTHELLSLATEMVDLKAFVHISTTGANCVTEVIEEKFYPPPIHADKLLSLLDILDDASLEYLTPVLLGKWPNTYMFTKAVVEDTLRRNCQKLPLCIVRPSGILPTAKEPIAGWIDKPHSVTGFLLGVSVGLWRTAYGDGDLVVDVIPADYVVSSVIVAAWDIAQTQSLNVNSTKNLTVSEIEEPPIYNVVSSCQKPITWGKLLEYTKKYMDDIPSMMCLWYYGFRFNKNLWLHKLSVILFHLIPATIVDSLASLTGNEPTMKKVYDKIERISSVGAYFTSRQWRFHNNNVLRLWTRMTSADRSEFDFNLESLNWKDYSFRHVRGIRVYLLKDPMDTVPQGRARYAKLRIAHYALVTALCSLLVWLLWTCFRLIGFL